MYLLIVGLLAGFGLPFQTGINTTLKKYLISPLVSSFVSFTVGTIYLYLLLCFQQQPVLVGTSFISQQPLWLWLGGVFGIIFLTGNILLFPRLGAIQTVTMPILGQISMSLLIDTFGFFQSPLLPLTTARLLGFALVLLGMLGLVKIAPPAHRFDHPTKWPWQLLGITTGMLVAMQTAINGRLGLLLHSSIHAALISFLVGSMLLVCILIGLILKQPSLLRQMQPNQAPWWTWTGGIVGANLIAGTAFLVPFFGTGLTVVTILSGMMLGGVVSIIQFNGQFDLISNDNINLPS